MQRRPDPEPVKLTDEERKRQLALLGVVMAVGGFLLAGWLIGDEPDEDQGRAWLVFWITGAVTAVASAVAVLLNRRRRAATSEELAPVRARQRAMMPAIVGIVAPLSVWGPEAFAWGAFGLFSGAGAGMALGVVAGLLLRRYEDRGA